jgi:hypothetical protein
VQRPKFFTDKFRMMLLLSTRHIPSVEPMLVSPGRLRFDNRDTGFTVYIHTGFRPSGQPCTTSSSSTG